jgi:short-subunit dehydrogenase
VSLNVVITGGSSGIGAATAELLASRDDNVFLVARRAGALTEVVRRCGTNARARAADMTRRDDVKRAVADAIESMGHIDVWINNVGRGITKMPTELTDEDIDDMMLVNVKSALYGMQEVLPHFRERNAGQVINVSSSLGRMPTKVFRSSYSAAKHFLNAITTAMRTEVQQEHPGIQFSLLSPGVVRTEFGVNALHGGPDSRSLPDSQSAEEVAAVMAWMIDHRVPDAYTRVGTQRLVADYYARLGVDPSS